MNDSTSASAPTPGDTQQPKWQPVDRIQRRVLGVLAEKAKTTPDQYPLTLNALRSGCNQKSNRAPLMELGEEDLYDALEKLRALGAVVEMFGSGRVPRYRHQLYQWLGVDGVELAVMAELLLRGAQTEGELRGRAARMEPIKDLSALRPVLAELKRKGLVIPLTPEGRGHIVTHGLYLPQELEKLRQQYGRGTSEPPAPTSRSEGGQTRTTMHKLPETAVPKTDPSSTTGATTDTSLGIATSAEQSSLHSVETEVAALREQVAELRHQLDELRQRVDDNEHDVQRIKTDLGI